MGLEKSLGFRAMRDKKTFELIGIPLELMDEFSTRRKEILEELSKRFPSQGGSGGSS